MGLGVIATGMELPNVLRYVSSGDINIITSDLIFIAVLSATFLINSRLKKIEPIEEVNITPDANRHIQAEEGWILPHNSIKVVSKKNYLKIYPVPSLQNIQN